jgi:hypothetical protein
MLNFFAFYQYFVNLNFYGFYELIGANAIATLPKFVLKSLKNGTK